MVEIDLKDDFLLKNEILLSKNVIFVYKGRYPKIQRKFSKNIETLFSILIKNVKTNVSRKTPPETPPIWRGRLKKFYSIFCQRIGKRHFKNLVI